MSTFPTLLPLPAHPSFRPSMRARSGASFVELVVVGAILTLLLFVSAPPLWAWASGVRVRLAAAEVASALYEARVYAIRHQSNVAVKFREDDEGRVTMTLYRDRDGDGVLSADIRRGKDVVERAERRLTIFDRRIRFGFPAGEAPRHPGSPGRRVGRLRDPIKFNRSDMASFDRLGTATPGSIYITDGVRHLAAVRVDHRSGKISILSYDRDSETWSRDG